MPNYNKYHKITLQITDENINILDKINQVKINNQIYLIYYGVLSHSPKTCPHCNQNSPCLISKNGHRRVKLKMPFISDKPVILYLDKQRFICKVCNKSFSTKTTEVRKYSNTSKNLRAGIIKKLSNQLTMKQIAKSYAISTNTVWRVQCELSKTLDRPKSLPAYMCFDELSSTSDSVSNMSFVYSNALTHQIQNILQGRTNNIIKNYFLYYSYKERCDVKAIVIDMNSGCKCLIRELFPNAKIIVDRFHIVQLVNRAFNKYRISYMNSIKDKDKDLYRQLKYYWKNLLILKLLENIKDRLKILCIIMDYQMVLWRGLIIRLKLLNVFLMDIDLFVTLEVRFFLFLVYFLLLILIKNLDILKKNV